MLGEGSRYISSWVELNFGRGNQWGFKMPVQFGQDSSGQEISEVCPKCEIKPTKFIIVNQKRAIEALRLKMSSSLH